MNYQAENIVAIASANGYAGVGVIRVSGTNLTQLIYALSHKQQIKPRYAHYSNFYAANNELIDSGLLLYFPAPHSFMGEDVLEIQAHGSPVGLNMLLKRCLELGCRLAGAGEFTKRAYLNAKLDLIQAESIIDLIHAESEASVKGALKSLNGEFSLQIKQINQQLINLRMFVEASLDFPEEDIEFIAAAKIKHKLELVQHEIYQLLANTKQGVILNNGATIVIIGRPNVGKSSLLNALANEEVAIVTPIAGTTRDIVRQKIIINGIVFNILDTAGIRNTDDVVELIGINRAITALNDADLCLVLIDDSVGVSKEDLELLQSLPVNLIKLYVHNKIDLTQQNPQITTTADGCQVYLSARNRDGIDLLRDKLLTMIGYQAHAAGAFLARTRHLEALQQCVKHIDYAFNNWQHLELLAEELRYANKALGEIVGEFSSEDLLGVIFSQFCIGK